MKTDAGAPLLPTKTTVKTTVSKASTSKAVFNVSTSIIGAGIMSIPATLKVLGVIPAFLMIVIVALLADLSVNLLLKFTYSGEAAVFSGETLTYGGVMREAFGWVGSLLVKVCVCVSNWGCLIVYLIILADVLSGSGSGETRHLGVLQEWFGVHWWNDRPYALLFLVVFVLLPLVLYRRVESLWFFSAIAVLLAVVFVFISFVMAILALIQGKTQTPRMFPEVDDHSSFFDLFTAVPVIVTAFTFHFNVHPISSELDKPSRMTKATKISLVLCVIIYFSVGFFGYLLFGESIASDILVNFDRSSGDSWLNDVVRLSYAFHLLLVYPLLNFSLRGNIDEILFPQKRVLADDNLRFVSLTVVILALSYLAAIAIPDIWDFYQYVGSTTIISIAFIFPAAITLRDVRGISSTKDKVVAVIMLVFAVVSSTISIATNISSGVGQRT